MKEPKGKSSQPTFLIGWQEWCALPELNIPAIRAKIDTGARTSALHAYDLQYYKRRQQEFVQFNIHPLQRNDQVNIACKARVIDQRTVTNSGGHKEKRYVILTPVTLAGITWDIEITLTNRDPMLFRMLLGRVALQSHVLINPNKKLLTGRLRKRELLEKYSAKL